jgi:hypothetical protein
MAVVDEITQFEPLQADDKEDLREGQIPNREFAAQLGAARLDGRPFLRERDGFRT